MFNHDKNTLQSFLITLAGTVVLLKFTVAGIGTESLTVGNPPSLPTTCERHSLVPAVPQVKMLKWFLLPGSGNTGGIQANVDRWMKQFEEPLGKKVDTVTIAKTE